MYVATTITSSHKYSDSYDDLANNKNHKPDNEKVNTMLYHTPIHKVIDYFKITNLLINDMSPNVPHPRCMFASPHDCHPSHC